MATIVQPYNPWREQLAMQAAGVVIPMITGMIQRNEEKAQNRLRNEALQKMISGDGALNEYMEPDMAMPEMPKLGGELGAWQGTMENELSAAPNKFSMEGLNIKPSAMAQSAAGQAQQMGGLARLANVLGDRRYSGLDTATMLQLAQPYVAEMEKAKREAVLMELANAVTGAGDDYSKWNTALGGAVRGYMDPGVLDRIAGMYQYNNPHMQPSMIDTGGGISYGSFDPRTGQRTEQGNIAKTVDPGTGARVGLGYAELGEKGREFDATFSETVTNNEFNRRMKLWEMENPECQIVKNDLGDHVEVMAVNPRTGEIKELFNGKVGMSPKDAAAVEANKADRQLKRDTLTETQKHNRNMEEIARNKTTVQRGTITDKDLWEQQVKSYDNRLAELDREKMALRKEISTASVDARGRRVTPPEELTTKLAELEAEQRALAAEQKKLLESGAPVRATTPQTSKQEMMMAVASTPADALDVLTGGTPEAVRYENADTGEKITNAQLEAWAKEAEKGTSENGIKFRRAGITDMQSLIQSLESHGFKIVQ